MVVVGRVRFGLLEVKYFGQLLERLHLLVPNIGIGVSQCLALESID